MVVDLLGGIDALFTGVSLTYIIVYICGVIPDRNFKLTRVTNLL